MLSKLAGLDTVSANEISKFASHWHNYAAQEIAIVINDFIRDVSRFRKKCVLNRLCDWKQNPDRQFVYLYVMDNILKNVQGYYITHFA